MASLDMSNEPLVRPAAGRPAMPDGACRALNALRPWIVGESGARSRNQERCAC
jgi:hypothetical protein